MASTETDHAVNLQPWTGPAILLLDLDAFFASVEQLDHPEWRGKPVIVGGDSRRRGVVATCSYEARAFGVRSAMPSATAERLCPQAIWTPGNFPRYIELSQQVMQIMHAVSPRLQQVSIDEAFLDVSPGRFGRDHPVDLARRISQQVAALGISASIGLGSSKTVAKIASDQNKPRGLTVVYPGSEAAWLAPLPLRVLSGIGPQSAARLEKFGLHHLGDVAGAAPALLQELFGKNAELIRQRCLGIDPSPVESAESIKSVSNEMTFSSDLSTSAELTAAIATVAAKVGRRLRHRQLAGNTVTLKLRYADLSIRTAQRTLVEPLDDEQLFTPIARELLPQIWRPGEAVRLVGIAVSGFNTPPPPTLAQLTLWENDAVATAAATDSASDPLVVSSNADQASRRHRTSVSTQQPGDPATGLPVARSTELDRALVLATDRVRDRFGEQAVAYGRELRFRQRDTGTIGQHKDNYKDPLHPPTDPGTKPRPDPPDSSKQQTLPENGDAMMDASATIPESGD